MRSGTGRQMPRTAPVDEAQRAPNAARGSPGVSLRMSAIAQKPPGSEGEQSDRPVELPISTDAQTSARSAIPTCDVARIDECAAPRRRSSALRALEFRERGRTVIRETL